MTRFPKRLQPIFWSKDVRNLDKNKDKAYVVHQILMFGALSDMKLLTKRYSVDQVKKIFISRPMKIYTKPAFHFIKDILLELKSVKGVDESKYVKTFPRATE